MQNKELAVHSPRSQEHKHLQNVYICKCYAAHKPDSKSMLCLKCGSAVTNKQINQKKIFIHWHKPSKVLFSVFKVEGGVVKVCHPDMKHSLQGKKLNRSFSAPCDSFLLFSYMQINMCWEQNSTANPLSNPSCN